MKCPNLFSGKNKKNNINLLSAELAQIVVNIAVLGNIGYLPLLFW